ncbi:MAG: transketolase, partial [Candidatus Binatia bacterium]
ADAVQKANSGHPGLPMGGAAMAYALWTRYLRHNPANPEWPDRDRFVLSAGHGSMLLYSLLHLTGHEMSIEDIRSFRQWESKTPGHPESHLTPGVETTTGPLGQGISNAVGMAIAEAHLAATFNRPGHEVIDHYTYVLAGDGDMMEGVANEACSLAGHLKLGKLIVFYDANRICLAGSTSISFTEDVGARLAASGWHVQHVHDGNDLDAICAALDAARAATDRPSVIVVTTKIGFGAPNKEGTFEAHGSPLGPEELRAAKERLGWPVEPPFVIPEAALENFRQAQARGKELEDEWRRRLATYEKEHPELARELRRRLAGELPAEWDEGLPAFEPDPKGIATRKASEKVMQALAARLPELMGGSADLNPSTFTWLKEKGDFQSPLRSAEGAQGLVGGAWGYEGRNLHFGVREHAMGAAVNGMSLHGGFIAYGSTFLIFSDYMRPALRLSAVMKSGSIWIYTHDGIGIGEDGPTHQAVEHYMALRAIPDLLFIRPADASETVEAWKVAIANRHRPTALALTRQNVPVFDRSLLAPADGLLRGGYVLNPKSPGSAKPDLVLIATGSEVQLIVAAEKALAADGVKVRLVSLPCWELFEEQPKEYRDSVLPRAVKARLAVETGVTLGWERWIGDGGDSVTLDRYGGSAPGSVLMNELGFTVENVVARARRLLGR